MKAFKSCLIGDLAPEYAAPCNCDVLKVHHYTPFPVLCIPLQSYRITMEMKRQNLEWPSMEKCSFQAPVGVLALVFRVICHSQNRKFRQAKKLYSFY